MAPRRKVLLLGGSTEATELAAWLATGDDVELLVSLKGVTSAPAALPGDLVVGGFGGAARLRDLLLGRRIDLLVDATHPFAVRIARNARRAAWAAAVPRLKLWRPPWQAEPGDRWTHAGDVTEAHECARALGRCPFVSLGARGVAGFTVEGFARVVFRAIERPRRLPVGAEFVAGRGPFPVADEMALFRGLGIDVLVTKNAGGAATAAKLEAARRLGLPVVMIRRPPTPPPPLAHSVDDAIAWLAPRLDRQGGRG